MTRRPGSVPRYCRHKASGQAIVRLNGRMHYLGRYGTKTSRLEYDRLVSEWLLRGRAGYEEECPTVSEIMVQYVEFAKSYYRKNGRETREAGCTREALRVLRPMYGRHPANEFKALALQAVRQEMVDLGWSRKYINKQTGRIVRMFKWAVSKELCDAEVHQSLMSVEGLRQGRTEAPDNDPIEPVSETDIQSTLPLLPETA